MIKLPPSSNKGPVSLQPGGHSLTRNHMIHSKHSVSLLFSADKVYDRKVIEGIGHYLQTSRLTWDVYIEEDFRGRLDNIQEWAGDGVIADFDDPQIREALQNCGIPVVGVGGSNPELPYYPDTAYVASDNHAVIQAAYDHLRQKGLENFAYYGLPLDNKRLWIEEREKAALSLIASDDYQCEFFRGQMTSPETWQDALYDLAEWLKGLPNPIGIIAVTDTRARHILQACDLLGLEVPERVSVIGIDDDYVARQLSRISLSSVSVGCFEIGYKAAKLLHKKLHNIQSAQQRVLVPPAGVQGRHSSDYKSLQDSYVIQAMHFIRQFATKGIKVEQVSDFVGISRSNLEHRFQAERGHSMHKEIHFEKLSRASQMLKETNLPLDEVAAVCGYPSVQYMYSIFKKHYNVTPKTYREESHSQADRAVNF